VRVCGRILHGQALVKAPTQVRPCLDQSEQLVGRHRCVPPEGRRNTMTHALRSMAPSGSNRSSTKRQSSYTPERVEAEVNKSFWPALWLCRSGLPYMIEQRSGAIVNLATHAVASRYQVPYATSKGGVMVLTMSLAKEVAPNGLPCGKPSPAGVPKASQPRPPSTAATRGWQWGSRQDISGPRDSFRR